MNFLYIANNAVIKFGLLRDLENGKKLYISFKDFEVKNNESSISCDSYIKEIKNGILTELDLLLIRKDSDIMYIDSYEIKSSKRNNYFKSKIQNQLFKQSLFLTFLVMDGLLIKQENLCIIEDINKVKYNIRVKYLNGINENYLKSLSLVDKINYISNNSYLVYDIKIENKDSKYIVDFYGVFVNKIYYERMEIEKNNLKKYIDILSEDYKKITKQFLLKNFKPDEKRKITLTDLINRFFISQSSYQVQE